MIGSPHRSIGRALGLVALFATRADAGPTGYGWLPQTETLLGSTFELATSLFERTNLGPYHVRSTSLMITPAVAVTPCLELALPIEWITQTADDEPPRSGVGRYGGELRWRVRPRGSSLHAVVRFGLSRNVAIQTQVRSEVGLAVLYRYDRFDLAAALGGVLDVNFGHLHEELRPALGVSARVTGELRAGVEFYGEYSSDSTTPSWAVVGPSAAWSRDRLWFAAMVGFGITNITAAPRLTVGMVW